jgi:cyclic-di-GMP phosphodiesterase TipF (flagellum assembly factor)
LVFEMTQNDLTAELLASVSTVGELAAIGFRFSMDRLDHLAVNPDLLASRGVRYLKVGYALLSAAERRGELDNLRRQLNAQSIELIVEKVETERQNQELELLGLESAQGFLFGEPRPSKRSAA